METYISFIFALSRLILSIETCIARCEAIEGKNTDSALYLRPLFSEKQTARRCIGDDNAFSRSSRSIFPQSAIVVEIPIYGVSSLRDPVNLRSVLSG